MENKRALRCAHLARIKRQRRYYRGQALALAPKQVGKAAQCAAVCSCWMCGNPRKYGGERTVQERRWMQAVDDE